MIFSFYKNPFFKYINDYEPYPYSQNPIPPKEKRIEKKIKMQKTSLKAKIEICAEEGIVIERYKDSIGVWTIGVGVTAAAGADINPKTYRGKITVRHAVDMMEKILPKYEKIVRKLLDGKIVPQHVFDGLVCAAYNIGPKFANGELTREYISQGEYRKALVMWRYSGGRLSPALLARRKREADICETGEYHAKIIPVYRAHPNTKRPIKVYDINSQELMSMMLPNKSVSV